jgi:hypothetical protein
MSLVNKEMNVLVFQVDNTTFEQVGEVNKIKSLIWQTPFNDYGEFQLVVPLDDENRDLLKEGRVIWTGEEVAAIVEYIQNDVDDDGLQTMKVKGHTLEKLLENRVINGTYSVTNGTVSGAITALVYQMFVAPSDNQKRKLPWLEVEVEDTVVPDKLSMQQTGKSVYEYIMELTETYEFGFRIKFDPINQKLTFRVLKGVDRSIDQDENDTVTLSTDMEDVIDSTYTLNASEWKNVAYVYGEGSGSARKTIISGDNDLSGFDRKELYVDARNVQSEIYNDDGTTTTISDTDYYKQLSEVGNEKLSENAREETFEASVRVFGNTQFEYGTDYFVGDKITVADERLGVQTSTWIVLAEETKDEEYSLDLTVGFKSPSIYKVVRRQVNW